MGIHSAECYVYKAAGSPCQLRGFATDGAGWNSWDAEPGESASDPDAQYNAVQSEKNSYTVLELADAFVWVKPGGESDGTTDSSATRYDSFCGKSDAYKPSPEAGTWNQAYFEMLLKNAKPTF